MKQKMKYFVFNKALDFNRCLLQNMKYEDHRLKINTTAQEHVCAMVSRVLDSQEMDMEWHQFQCRLHKEGNTAIRLSVYAANSLIRQAGTREEDIGHILLDMEIPLQKKKEMLYPYLQKTVLNTDDILLHDVKGRYLWFILESAPQAGQNLEIEKIQIYFPKQSWISYMPEIYQENDPAGFVPRFLAVFQTMYEALNEEIRKSPYRIDVDCADREFLEWLAKWLDLSQSYMWTDSQLRTLLKNAAVWYKIRGTRQSVIEFVKLYTGSSHVYVVENFQTGRQKLYERLYGNDPYKFQVIVREQDVPAVREYQTLIKIITEIKPAYMELELIVLKPYIFLDQHAYMGINSVLGKYQETSLDGTSMLSFTMLSADSRLQ